MCEITTQTYLDPHSGSRIFGYARWRKDWVEVSSALAQDRRAWGASIRAVVNSIAECRNKYLYGSESLWLGPGRSHDFVLDVKSCQQG